MNNDFNLKSYLAEGKLLKEEQEGFNINNHQKEALDVLNQFVDEFIDIFEFIPDLNNYHIDDNNNSLNVDELGSVFLIPDGSSIPEELKGYMMDSNDGEINDNGVTWKKYPKNGYYYIAIA